MDGAIAWHLIERHADGWAEVGEMMDAWCGPRRPAFHHGLLAGVVGSCLLR